MFAKRDRTLSAGRRWAAGGICRGAPVGTLAAAEGMPGVLGLGVVARGLLAEIADNTVRGREKLKSNPLKEFRGRCQVAGPYLPFGRYSNLSWGRSSNFNFLDTD